MALSRAFLRLLLASPLAAGAVEPPFPAAKLPFEQKWDWSWSSLTGLKDQIKKSVEDNTDGINGLADLKDKVKEHTDKLSGGIDGYKQAAKDYADALKDNSFTKAIAATGICDRLPKAEDVTAPVIEDSVADPMTDMAQDPGEVPAACEAAADEVTAEELQNQLKDGDTSDIADKFMKLVTSRSSASLCEGNAGVQKWLKDHAGLRESSPEEYKKQLKAQLKGKVGPILKTYTSKLCPEEEDQRLFALGSGPLVRRGAAMPIPLAVVAASGLLGLGALAFRRRAARWAEPQEDLEQLMESGQEL